MQDHATQAFERNRQYSSWAALRAAQQQVARIIFEHLHDTLRIRLETCWIDTCDRYVYRVDDNTSIYYEYETATIRVVHHRWGEINSYENAPVISVKDYDQLGEVIALSKLRFRTMH